MHWNGAHAKPAILGRQQHLSAAEDEDVLGGVDLAGQRGAGRDLDGAGIEPRAELCVAGRST